jgi:hypothetical protein
VLKRISGPKKKEATEGCRKLHHEELHNLYSSPNIINVIQKRKMRWPGHVTRMVDMSKNSTARDHLGFLGVDSRMMSFLIE